MRKFSCLIACLLCLSCLRDPSAPNNEPEAPGISYEDQDLTRASVTLSGTLSGKAKTTSQEVTCGFIVTELVNGEEKGNSQESTAELKEDNTFSWTAELKQEVNYSARAYVSNGLSRKYSKPLMITAPASSKATVSSVTLTDGFLSAVLKDDGGRKIEELGFVWGTSPERKQLLREKKIPAEVIDGNRFTQSLRPFEVGETYYILAYAIDNKEDVGYSPEPLELTLTEDDYVHFEDPNFEAQVLRDHDQNKDGKMAYGELKEITELSVITDNVASVQEISLMPALQEFFCNGSAPQKGQLNHLDLTVVPQLTSLSCTGNQLDKLDISPCPDMNYLDCLGNPLDTVWLAATQNPETLRVPKNTVVFYLISGFSLKESFLSMLTGDSHQLSPVIEPEGTVGSTVTWTSSDTQVVTVSPTGLLTAHNAGSCTITGECYGKTASCEVTVTTPVGSITLNKTTLSLVEEESETLIATITPSDATDKTVIWASSNSQVASVDQDGKVTALKEGVASITATAGGKSATCIVTVNKQFVPVSKITLSNSSLELIKGTYEVLTASVEPEDATDKTLTWSSSDEDVSVVSSTGRVFAIGVGSAIITVKAGEQTATCDVLVTVPVTSITLNKTNLTLVEGQSETLVATVMPADATDKDVTWVSSNPEVASVDQEGKVTALKEGETSITATAGGKSATCQIAVKIKFIPVTRITLNKSSLKLIKGTYEVLTATVEPENATDKSLTWTSSNEDIAVVSNTGRVTAIEGGSAIITVKAGEQTATCAVQVTVPVTSITLNKTSLTLVEEESETLIATVMPANATAWKTWTSSNTSVATVDQNGTVVAVKEGVASITASAGGKSATCQVTVNKKLIPVSNISLNKTSLTLVEEQSETLIATVMPADATDKTVTWASSNSQVASIDQDGKVTALKEGVASITATAGGKTATCQVTVNKKLIPVTRITLNKSSMELAKGTYEVLTATVEPEDATDKTVNWSSSNPDVATVNNEGRVTAIGGGSAIITVKAGEQTATCEVSVSVPVTGISLNKTRLELNRGDQETLVATITPEDATEKTITWSTEDYTIASVSKNGKVTAVNEGSTTITASIGSYSASCAITVVVPISAVSFPETEREVYIGENFTLIASVFPEDTTDPTFTWDSSHPEIATVTQNGEVYPIGIGNTTITATSSLGISASFECIVVSEAPIFPDESFNAYVYEHFDTDQDGFLSRKEAMAVNDIRINNQNNQSVKVKSLSGIQCFELLSYLDCSYNDISSLDITHNTELTHLYCESNNLSEIDLTNAQHLSYLDCSNNSISVIDISNNTGLKSLRCNNNNLTELPISNAQGLYDLQCSYNHLTALDVNSNTELVFLDCRNNSISAINMPDLLYIEQLKCQNNELKVLDVSQLSKLKYLYCEGNGLSKLSVSNNPCLFVLSCSNNYLTTLDLSNNSRLAYLYCNDNILTQLFVNNSPELCVLRCQNNLLEILDLNNCKALQDFYCYNNLLTELDVSNCPNLREVICEDNHLKHINISECPELLRLRCGRNDLQQINISGAVKLQLLQCASNNISTLDISHCPDLFRLWCDNNNLNELSLDNNLALEELTCGGNLLTCLDVSQNLQLGYLSCSDNPNLTEIWLSEGQTIDQFYYNSSIATVYYK